MNPLASHGLRLFSILCALTLLPSCVITVAEGGGHANSPEPARKKKKRRRMKKPAPSKPVTPIKSTRPDYKKRVPPKPTLVAQPPRTAPRRSTTRPAQLPAGIGEGRPDGFRPGAPAAYWIWQGPRGQWRVRTTTAKALRHFRGHVVGVTSGSVDFPPPASSCETNCGATHQAGRFPSRRKGTPTASPSRRKTTGASGSTSYSAIPVTGPLVFSSVAPNSLPQMVTSSSVQEEGSRATPNARASQAHARLRPYARLRRS